MLASSGTSNPFADLYAAISGRGETASTSVLVYFPHTQQPRGKPMNLSVRRDATVEEVIGFALWNYWEEGWLPKLDEGLSEDDPKREIKLSAVGWILRIAEDDGEVDDDFPREFSEELIEPNVLRVIQPLIEMVRSQSSTQKHMLSWKRALPKVRIDCVVRYSLDLMRIYVVQQNQVLESKIQRRPSRTGAAKRPDKLNLPNHTSGASTPGSAVYGSNLTTSMLSSALGPSSVHGPQIFLRIRVADTADAVHISTTIPV